MVVQDKTISNEGGCGTTCGNYKTRQSVVKMNTVLHGEATRQDKVEEMIKPFACGSCRTK